MEEQLEHLKKTPLEILREEITLFLEKHFFSHWQHFAALFVYCFGSRWASKDHCCDILLSHSTFGANTLKKKQYLYLSKSNTTGHLINV